MSETAIELTNDQEDMLTEMMNISIGRAANSLSTMLGTEVIMTVPKINFIASSEDLPKIMHSVPTAQMTSVSMLFSGPFWGNASVVMPKSSSDNLVNLLSSSVAEEANREDISEDILLEVGNVIITACLSCIGDIFDSSINNSLPRVSLLACNKLLNFNQKETENDSTLAVNVQLSAPKSKIAGSFILVVNIQSFEVLKERLDTYIEDNI